MNTQQPQITTYLAALPEWQRANLELFRELVHQADPTLTEDFKWNVPVFLLNGKVIFAMSAFKAHTKYNFMANGALLQDTSMLFNNGMDSKRSRAIDLREGERVDEAKLLELIRQSLVQAGVQ